LFDCSGLSYANRVDAEGIVRLLWIAEAAPWGRTLFDALPSGSPVLVQEYLLDDDKSGQLLGVFQWYGLLDGTTGDQRTAAEIGALLERSGFRDIETRPIDREQSIVIGWKA